MSVVTLSTRRPGQVATTKPTGLQACQQELERRLAALPGEAPDRESQMDERRKVEALHRVQHAIQAYLTRRAHGLAPSADQPRVMMAHRSDWWRRCLRRELSAAGMRIAGEAEDGAVAIAMTVVEQPELLLLEDRLPWVTPLEVVGWVHSFAPSTRVVVHLEDSGEAQSLLEAGACAVLSRGLPPERLAQSCVDLLTGKVVDLPA